MMALSVCFLGAKGLTEVRDIVKQNEENVAKAVGERKSRKKTREIRRE